MRDSSAWNSLCACSERARASSTARRQSADLVLAGTDAAALGSDLTGQPRQALAPVGGGTHRSRKPALFVVVRGLGVDARRGCRSQIGAVRLEPGGDLLLLEARRRRVVRQLFGVASLAGFFLARSHVALPFGGNARRPA